MLTYNPPPHMNAKALIERAARLLGEWQRKYGEHQPDWLPPAGEVRWMEDAAAFIEAHTLPPPTVLRGIQAVPLEAGGFAHKPVEIKVPAPGVEDRDAV